MVVPTSRRELSAFMVAKSDPTEYGKLEVFVMPRDRQVDGPAIVNARINQEPEVSSLITLLSRAGSEVLLGNLVIIPVEQSLIYIRSLYVQATGATRYRSSRRSSSPSVAESPSAPRSRTRSSPSLAMRPRRGKRVPARDPTRVRPTRPPSQRRCAGYSTRRVGPSQRPTWPPER